MEFSPKKGQNLTELYTMLNVLLLAHDFCESLKDSLTILLFKSNVFLINFKLNLYICFI